MQSAVLIRSAYNDIPPIPPTAPIILDPVMVSTSGSLLLSHDSIHALISKLLPLCTLLTPNIPEAKQILAHASSSSTPSELTTLNDLLSAAKEIAALGPEAVLIKGGHNAMTQSQFDTALTQIATGTDVATVTFESDSEALATGAQITSWQLRQSSGKMNCVRADTWPNSVFLQSLFEGDVEAQDIQVVVDVLYHAPSNTYTCFVKRRVDKSCTHGTGCTLSSALAVHTSVHTDAQALQANLAVDVWKSINYVQAAIMRGYEDLGSGPGALDHAVSVQPRGVLSSTATGLHVGSKYVTADGDVTTRNASRLDNSLGPDPTPFTTQLLSRSIPLWTQYVWHPLIQSLSHSTGLSVNGEQGSLRLSSFAHFLKQDYHFLLHSSRVWSLAATQYASTFETSQLYNTLSSAMAFEASSHVDLCEKYFNLSRDDLDAEPEGSAVMSYTRFVLDVGRTGELELLTATLPCLLGYAEMAHRLKQARQQASTITHDGLQQWLDLYTGPEYIQALKAGLAHVEQVAEAVRPSVDRMKALQRIWNAAVRLEIGMWDESMRFDERDWVVYGG